MYQKSTPKCLQCPKQPSVRVVYIQYTLKAKAHTQKINFATQDTPSMQKVYY
jgi:hypothetical protein